LQQLVLPVQQFLGNEVIRRQADLPFAALITERPAAGAFEPLARAVIDPQIHRVANQQPEHRAAMEQPDATEHAARHRSQRCKQIQDEVLKALAHRH
jgi:hypothetical protein